MDATDSEAISRESAAPDHPYAHLAVRATAFIRDHGGAVHEDRLIGHVFGGAGSTDLWRPLLRQVLRGGDDLTLRADGFWTLTTGAADGAAPLLSEFVVLDVETTGLKPYSHRVIEIAAIRFGDGQEHGRFETLCHPGRQIPRFIAELTGIDDALVADAPPFAALADDLVGFLGSTLVVGHNVAFDFGFINAELKRLGRPGLINERLDTRALAVASLPRIRKPSLDAVARELGLAYNDRKLHRAGPDAMLTANVVMALAARTRAAGITSLEDLRRYGATGARRSVEDVGRGRAVLDRSLLADIPRAPGVYIMRDRFDQVIYVGKAKNLRDRVSSYFSEPIGYTRKMDGLLESLERIEVEIAGSELEALLLESQLIRRYQPRYNTALRSYEQYPFIRVDVSNPWPRLTLAKVRRADGARYFGPYRNTAAARKTVDLINQVVPLRTCSRSFKTARSYGSPCLELDLGRCLGPCAGLADREQYTLLVRDVVAFLDGRESGLYQRLWQGLEAAAAALDYERAGKLRRALQTAEGIVAAQRAMHLARDEHTVVLVLPSAVVGAREVLLIYQGVLWAQLQAAPEAGSAVLANRLADCWQRCLAHGVPAVDHHTVDDVHILNRWLAGHAGHPSILPVLPMNGEPGWMDLADRVLALTLEELFRDPPERAVQDASEEDELDASHDLKDIQP